MSELGVWGREFNKGTLNCKHVKSIKEIMCSRGRRIYRGLGKKRRTFFF